MFGSTLSHLDACSKEGWNFEAIDQDFGNVDIETASQTSKKSRLQSVRSSVGGGIKWSTGKMIEHKWKVAGFIGLAILAATIAVLAYTSPQHFSLAIQKAERHSFALGVTAAVGLIALGTFLSVKIRSYIAGDDPSFGGSKWLN